MARPRISVTREGWMFIFVPSLMLAGSLLQQVNLVVMLAALLLGSLLISWRIVGATVRGLRVRRRLPREIRAGDVLNVEIEVENVARGRAAWAIHVRDRVRRRGAVETAVLEPDALIPRIPSKGTETATYRGRLMRRGRYEFGPIVCETRFPLGFIRGQIALPQSDELLVTPRVGRLNRRWRQLLREAEVGGRQTQRRHGLHEGDFFGLREWRRGDSSRWVHWRTSAKRSRMMVRQFERPRNQDFALLLNLQANPGDAAADDAVELAVSFAATIASDLFRVGGAQLMFGVAGAEPCFFRGPLSTAMLSEVNEHLTDAESHSEDRLPDLLRRAFAEIPATMNVVLLSSRPVNLLDEPRFASLWNEPHQAAAAARTTCIDCGGDALSDFYRLDVGDDAPRRPSTEAAGAVRHGD